MVNRLIPSHGDSKHHAWFITSANHGIGLKIVEDIVARANTVLFAGIRTLETNGAAIIRSGTFQSPHRSTRIDIYRSYRSCSETIEVTGSLDMVGANAGIAKNWQPATEADFESFRNHLEVNLVRPLILFKPLYPFLKNEKHEKVLLYRGLFVITNILTVNHTIYRGQKPRSIF